MLSEPITFFVYGKPEPQGSVKAFVVKGRPILTSTNNNLKDWRQTIVDAAQGIVEAPIGGAVELEVDFFLPRPASLPGYWKHPTKKPDLDKLVRSVCDALTHTVLRDDSQVVAIKARKEYCDGGPVGVNIMVTQIWEHVPKVRKPRLVSIHPIGEVL
jgi:Holliday junction resolvase RusA-like endonuclease